MAKKIKFTAQQRTQMGKKTKFLRRQGVIPANVSGDIETPVAISFDKIKFVKLYEEVGDTGLFYLTIEEDGKDLPVLVDDVQMDPVTDEISHVVFKQVNLKEKISADVPVELVGENDVPGAVVVGVVDSVEVEALPTDLPENFEIDISKLTEIGQSITFSDLDYDKSLVTLMIEEEEMTNPVVLLQEQAAQEPEEEPETEEAEAGGDGEAPAEEKSEETTGESEKKTE